jgi:hypothetical protein
MEYLKSKPRQLSESLALTPIVFIMLALQLRKTLMEKM